MTDTSNGVIRNHAQQILLSPYSTGKRDPTRMKLTPKKVKCTWPTPKFCVGTQRNLYSTGLRLVFASGKMQLLVFASGKTRKNLRHLHKRYQHVDIIASGDAKVLSFVLGDAKVPNASSFASQWNIGFKDRAWWFAAILGKLQYLHILISNFKIQYTILKEIVCSIL